jgi:RecA-family ATPase
METLEGQRLIDVKLLDWIPPDCSYDEWTKVGMALKHEGADLSVWEDWSSRGTKYKPGECRKKWESFRRNEVTGGTLFFIAVSHGYDPTPSQTSVAYDLHNLILEENIVDPTFVSQEAVPPPPQDYDPKGEMLEYFTTLFSEDDFVGYCIKFFFDTKEGKWKPAETMYRRTAGDIIQKLRTSSIEVALGTFTPGAGAYVRFNPLDGKGENNANVTRWQYCLVESDTDSIERQHALLKAMNLPIKFLIHSGGKSLHAIVKIDAENAQQYRARVRELYEFCKKSGFHPDEQDKNESRFSRLPGVKRGDKWQYIVGRDMGPESYDAWIEWRQTQADDLPPEESLADVWGNMPELREELIPGILRVGHKLLLAGPSKAGKSFLLIDLAIALAEGTEWLGAKCRQSKVLYVNLELDRPSCLHRFKDIYTRLGKSPDNLGNISIWNLRGKAAPMNRLAPILINRFKDARYGAVIIDPIYKVITGDENNATEMSQFCAYFDQIASDLGVSVIYCHHHSKGASGKYANAADRSSGSGVFARDPDAILDLRELKTDGLTDKYRGLHPDAAKDLTAWEISGTFREFPPVPPQRVWFDFPIHVPDKENFLANASYNDSGASGRGVGDSQTAKVDWFQTVEDMLGVSFDSAVSLESVGISESNAKKKFGAETDYEVATVEGTKVVHRRTEDEIEFGGKVYRRNQNGKRCVWNELR